MGNESQRARCPFCKRNDLTFNETADTPWSCAECGVRFRWSFARKRQQETGAAWFLGLMVVGALTISLSTATAIRIAGLCLAIVSPVVGSLVARRA